MRINELVPFKQDPLYQLSTTADSDIIKTLSANDLRKELLKRGFKRIGSGSHSLVYEHGSYPLVFKIFQDDQAYLWFLNYVLENTNVHLPRIKGRFIKLKTANDPLYVVRLEKLKTDNSNPVIRSLQAYTSALSKKIETPIIDRVLEKFPELIKLVNDINQSKPRRYNWDIGKNNIMFRGRIPVLIDPIAF